MRNCGRSAGDGKRGALGEGVDEDQKETHYHPDVLSGARLDAAHGLRRARFGPVLDV